MIRDHWYVGCASSQLTNAPFSTQIGEQKIVLFRNANGTACALIDRCCHRGMPLSKGKMIDGNISCAYHGWEFGSDGKCVKIPSLAENKTIPRNYCVNSFSCEEKDGYIWIWIGDEAKKTPAPAIPEFADGKWIQGSRTIQCNYMRALEITFDGSHLYFVHPTHPATIAAQKFGFAPTQQEIRLTDDGCVAFLPPAKAEQDEIPAEAFRMKFSLPGEIRFEMPMLGQGAYMIFFTTPLTKTSCRMDWIIANMGIIDSPERVLWTGEGREIIEEDQFILEEIQKAYDAEGETFERSVEADLPALTMRKIVKLAEENEWPAGRSHLAKRAIFTSMGPAAFG